MIEGHVISEKRRPGTREAALIQELLANQE